ncbi:hypothetical protein DID97_34050 [Burkholderia sp. Bp8977]|nr:hypothetical protein DIE10_35550 [Burkholderia sp. Bp9011]RQR83726.1 hypothetical protein DIE09_35720 [Burkholderia sp. Bp9010]RQS64427.1 hypothetical protein DID97_34050 [Burkholderia sp. Bp8977]
MVRGKRGSSKVPRQALGELLNFEWLFGHVETMVLIKRWRQSYNDHRHRNTHRYRRPAGIRRG